MPVAETSEPKAILAELRSGLEAIYGDRLVELALFGSRARGDARPQEIRRSPLLLNVRREGVAVWVRNNRHCSAKLIAASQ